MPEYRADEEESWGGVETSTRINVSVRRVRRAARPYLKI